MDFEFEDTVPATINLELEKAGKIKKGSFDVEFHYRDAPYVDSLVAGVKDGGALDEVFLEQELVSVSKLRVNGQDLSPEDQRAAVFKHIALRTAVIGAWLPAMQMAASKNSKPSQRR